MSDLLSGPPGPRRRFPSRQLRHHELRAAHLAASGDLAAIDTALEEVLTRRRGCLDTLADLRVRLNVRYTTHHLRWRHRVDEPPVPPAPADAKPLESIDLRSVCLTLLRRHGPQRLRDLHGLLHCYGYYVAGVRPVQRLGDAMAYEERCGRARRVARGTYEAVADAPEPPRPGWWGPSPAPGPQPLPWSRPETDPGPPLVDPRVADDPELWSGRAWPDPAPGALGDDSSTNRPRVDGEVTADGRVRPEERSHSGDPSRRDGPVAPGGTVPAAETSSPRDCPTPPAGAEGPDDEPP